MSQLPVLYGIDFTVSTDKGDYADPETPVGGQDKLRFEVELPTVEEREEWVIKLMGEIGG